jgi:copper chaperone CopZ
MQRKSFILTMLLLASVCAGAGDLKSKNDTVFLRSNMHCLNCQKSIFELLRFEKGVRDLEVDHVSNTMMVVFDGKKTSPETIADVVVRKGYLADIISGREYNQLVKKSREKESAKE